MTEPADRGPGGAAFGQDIDRRLAAFRDGPPPLASRYLSWGVLLLLVLIGLVVWAFMTVPNGLFDPATRTVIATLGFLAVWRYSWWATHAVRSERYGRRVYPAKRRRARAVWDSGWRPEGVHFMMTTYREDPEITRRVIDSIADQVRETGIPGHVWVGTGDAFDEEIITDHVHGMRVDPGLDVTFVRQNLPGKRMAIGALLRAMRRSGVGERDLVLFMDGDTVLLPGTLITSAAHFGADPELQALTTDEDVICYGPGWMERWLRMRFAQRRVAMQSHALSGRVLTLTGRMSMFRGRFAMDPRFIRMLEADHLDHWLWGRFRFLSGDDKSTWYYLLSQSAKMIYVPDALVVTVDVVKGDPTKRMIANLRRWSGNMLRNGARAIALGPRRTGGFIWWCLIDQRIAILTTLVSPVLAIYGSVQAPAFAVTAVLWVLATRIVLSLYLFRWARQIDPTWPILLYVNQIVNASVKLFLMFRIHQQAWPNRGVDAHIGESGWTARLKLGVANVQMVTTVTAFLWVLALWSGVVPIP